VEEKSNFVSLHLSQKTQPEHSMKRYLIDRILPFFLILAVVLICVDAAVEADHRAFMTNHTEIALGDFK